MIKKISLLVTLIAITLIFLSFKEDDTYEQDNFQDKDKPCKNNINKCDDEDLPIDTDIIWVILGTLVLGLIYINKKNK